ARGSIKRTGFLRDFPDPPMQLITKDRIKGPHRPRQRAPFGDHVEALTALDGSDGNHRGLERIDLAADQGLQMKDEMGGDHDGIHRFMGKPSVSPFSENVDLKEIGGCHEGAGLDPNHSDRERSPEMNPVHGVHALQGPVLDHLPGAAGNNLFGMLKEKTDLSRSEEHTSELQSRENLVCRLLLEKKKKNHEATE